MVNDGSTDNTQATLEKLSVKVIKHKERYGYTQALKTGMKYVTRDYIFCIDGDGQYRPLPVELPDKDTIVNGYKVNRRDNGLRVAMSILSNFIAKVFFKITYHDLNSGYKIFHKDIIPLFNKVRYMTLSPWGEFLIRVYYEGYNIKDIPVKHYKRLHGSSKLMKSMTMVSYTNGIGGAKLYYEIFRSLVKGILITEILNLIGFNDSHIIDNIYIGGYRHTPFDTEINVRSLPNGFAYYDMENLDKFVEEINNSKSNVLVYCKRGMVRSATVIAAYLIKYRNFSVELAKSYLQEKRNYIFLGYHQMRTLREYKRWLGR